MLLRLLSVIFIYFDFDFGFFCHFEYIKPSIGTRKERARERESEREKARERKRERERGKERE